MNSSKLRLSALVLGLSLLTACTAASSSTGTACPPLTEYSGELLQAAAEEIELIPIGGAIEIMLMDYAMLRDQVRACQ